jgi:hypothetical protein
MMIYELICKKDFDRGIILYQEYRRFKESAVDATLLHPVVRSAVDVSFAHIS